MSFNLRNFKRRPGTERQQQRHDPAPFLRPRPGTDCQQQRHDFSLACGLLASKSGSYWSIHSKGTCHETIRCCKIIFIVRNPRLCLILKMLAGELSSMLLDSNWRPSKQRRNRIVFFSLAGISNLGHCQYSTAIEVHLCLPLEPGRQKSDDSRVVMRDTEWLVAKRRICKYIYVGGRPMPSQGVPSSSPTFDWHALKPPEMETRKWKFVWRARCCGCRIY